MPHHMLNLFHMIVAPLNTHDTHNSGVQTWNG